jgi:hypothetical protein
LAVAVLAVITQMALKAAHRVFALLIVVEQFFTRQTVAATVEKVLLATLRLEMVDPEEEVGPEILLVQPLQDLPITAAITLQAITEVMVKERLILLLITMVLVAVAVLVA